MTSPAAFENFRDSSQDPKIHCSLHNSSFQLPLDNPPGDFKKNKGTPRSSIFQMDLLVSFPHTPPRESTETSRDTGDQHSRLLLREVLKGIPGLTNIHLLVILGSPQRSQIGFSKLLLYFILVLPNLQLPALQTQAADTPGAKPSAPVLPNSDSVQVCHRGISYSSAPPSTTKKKVKLKLPNSSRFPKQRTKSALLCHFVSPSAT